MSNLSDLLPAGGSGKTVEMVASGALSNGDKVILQSDGTSKVISNPLSRHSQANIMLGGTIPSVNSSYSYISCVAIDSGDSTKIIVAYSDGTSRIVSGTITGSSITFGTPYVFYSGNATNMDIVHDPDNSGSFIFLWGYSNKLYRTVITVTGSTISKGSDVKFESGTSNNRAKIRPVPNNPGYFLVAWKIYNKGYVTLMHRTGSQTSLTQGTKYEFYSASADNINISLANNSSGKFIIGFQATANSNRGYVVVGDITSFSSKTISLGSFYYYESDSQTRLSGLEFDMSDPSKFVVVWPDSGSSNYGSARVGSISGTTITWGTQQIYKSANCQIGNSLSAYSTGFVFTFIYYTGSSYLFYAKGCYISSGTTLVFLDVNSNAGIMMGANASQSTPNYYRGLAMGDPTTDGRFILSFDDSSNSRYIGVALIEAAAKVSNLTADNFIGTAEGAFADTATATVMLRGGITTTQSSLTIGSTYYVQGDGTLSTTPGSPSVTAGKALTATALLIGGSS
jgi:hypothetical protein